MAITDHTETSRPSRKKNAHPTSTLSRPRELTAKADEAQRHRAAMLDGLVFAHQAVEKLLDDTLTYRKRHRNDAKQCDVIDTLIKTVHGLFSATYFLNQYAEMVLRESVAG